MIPTAKATSQQLCTVTLLGNLVSTPEIRYLANPVLAVTEIVLATHQRWLDKKTKVNKEWTSYHHIKVVGEQAENALRFAQKGDLLFVQGCLTNSKKTNDHLIHANFLEHFAKGYTPSINQIHCSGVISHPLNMVTTEHNKLLTAFTVTMTFQTYSAVKQDLVTHKIERLIHAWGNNAKYLSENANAGDTIVIEGRVSYHAGSQKEQFIDANQIHLLKKK